MFTGARIGFSICVSLLIFTSTSLLFGGAANREVQRPASIHFSVRNYARVPDEILTAATAEVSRIFQQIAVASILSNESLESDQRALRQSNMQPKAAEMQVHILARSFLVRNGDAMGLAQEKGLIAYIFYDRIKEFVGEFESEPRIKGSLTLVLAAMIAHETGHLLLPGQSHRPLTLMKPTWRSSDVYGLETRRITFATDQAAVIRHSLSQLIRNE